MQCMVSMLVMARLKPWRAPCRLDARPRHSRLNTYTWGGVGVCGGGGVGGEGGMRACCDGPLAGNEVAEAARRHMQEHTTMGEQRRRACTTLSACGSSCVL